MIFSKDQAALILAGRMSATLTPVSHRIKVDAVRQLRRRVMRHDADGVEQGWETSAVMQGEGEDRQPVLLTILAAYPVELAEITLQQAQWCGHKTVLGCRAAWEAEHSQPVAQLVRFALGDIRDKDRYLARGGGYTTTRHLSVAPDAPAVPPDEQRRQTMGARKTEAARVADPDIKLRLSLSRALEEWEIETGGVASGADVFKSIKAIRQQIRTLDRRLKVA